MRGGSRGRVEHRAVLGIEPEQPASLTMVRAHVARLQDLVALATGRGPALLWLKAFWSRAEPDEEPSAHNYPQEVDFYTRCAVKVTPSRKR